jgi:hypothetical protein
MEHALAFARNELVFLSKKYGHVSTQIAIERINAVLPNSEDTRFSPLAKPEDAPGTVYECLATGAKREKRTTPAVIE